MAIMIWFGGNKMSNNYFIHLSGGLGDILQGYLTKPIRKGLCSGFGYLKQIKNQEPDCKVKLIIHPIQEIAKQLFETHPLIDEITQLGWHNPCHVCGRMQQEAGQGYIGLGQHGKDNGWTHRPWKKIFLTDKDKETTEQIINDGPYVAIHPFAGDNPRTTVPINQWPSIIDNIIKHTGYNVVVLGASHVRKYNPKRLMPRDEKFVYQRDKLFNLVNKVNIRCSVELAQKSSTLIATNSALLCAASTGNTPLIALHNNPKVFVGILNRMFVSSEKYSAVTKNEALVTNASAKIIELIRKNNP